MALTTTSGIPGIIVKGDAYSFTVSSADFPVASWTSATIYFKSGTTAAKSFPGTVSGSGHLFTLTNANTGTLSAGRNLVSVSWSDGTHRGSSAWSEITVLDDPSAATTATHAENMVAALEAALLTLSAGGTSSVSVDGVTYTKRDQSGLERSLIQWQAAVINERRAADATRGVTPPRIVAVFG